MITALDSSVLLDVILNDSKFAASSLAAISQARRDGKLVICDAVVAELMPTLPARGQFDLFLQDLEAEFIPLSLAASKVAGEYFERYRKSGGKRGRVAADFLIGGHARLHAERLLTRDAGFYRKHFRGLKVITP